MRQQKHLASFRGLLASLLEYRYGIIQLLLLQTLWLLFELVIPFLTQALVDQGIVNQDIDFIYLVLMGQLMIFVGATSSEFFKSWMLRHIGVRLNKKLIVSLMERLLIKDALFFNKKGSGEIIQLIMDNFRIERFLTDHLSGLFDAVLRIILYGIILFVFNPFISLIFLISVVFTILWDIAFLGQRKKLDEARFAARSQHQGDLIEVVNGVLDIKVNNLEAYRSKRWASKQDILSALRMHLLRIHQYNHGGFLTFTQLRDIFILFFTANFVVEGTITLGGMLAIQYILGQLGKQTGTVVEFLPEYQDAKLSLQRLAPIIDDPEPLHFYEPTPTAKFEEPIQLKNVHFTYDEAPCLKDISFEIPYGSKVAIVGESGSGKSTLIKSLLRLLEPQEGLIYIGNRRLDHISRAQWNNNCSVVLQESIVFQETLEYNITLCKEAEAIDHDLLFKTIEVCCLTDIVNKLDKGVKTALGTGGKTLSKGQSQRVLLARAIYKNANYLIMDEPTSALDTVTTEQVVQNIKAFSPDKTIIFVTHKTRIAEQMEQIILIEEGEILEHGTHDELLALKGNYYKLFTA